MGGIGSGRHWHYNTKSTVNSYRTIDIRKWCREDLLTPGSAFIVKWLRNGETTESVRVLVAENHIMLNCQYKKSGESKDIEYSIAIEWRL